MLSLFRILKGVLIMGFLSGIGKVAGNLAGGIVGGAIEVVGESVNSKALKGIGQGVNKTISSAGEALGQVTDGVVTTASGLIKDDSEQVKQG
jgi:hypothetical protein